MSDRASQPSRLHQPVARLLRPLVRLLIRGGVTYPALCEMLRELYVNVAENDFALPGKPQTDSRVSLVTGIHRKEVSRLRGAGAPVNAVPVTVSRTSQIIGRWLAGPPFAGPDGRPLPLSRTGEGASFEHLVTSVTRDLRPRAVLDEWLDRGLAAVDDDGRVVLAEAGFVPKAGEDEQFYFFGRNLHDHMAAAVANVMGDGAPFLERAVHYDGLSQAAAQALQAHARDAGLQVLQAANRAAQTTCETDCGGGWRWNFGLYVYAAPDPGSPRAAPADGDAPGSEA